VSKVVTASLYLVPCSALSEPTGRPNPAWMDSIGGQCLNRVLRSVTGRVERDRKRNREGR
jgi:hypothetical protein